MAIFLRDITGNGNTLTNNGTSEITSSLPFAQSTVAVDLEDSESDYLTAGDSITLSQTGNMTLECWINLESNPSSGLTAGLIEKVASFTSYRIELFNDGGTQKIQAEITGDGNAGTVDTARWTWSPSTGTWYHIALTITPGNATANTFELFIDGSSQGNGTIANSNNPASIFDSAGNFEIGRSRGGSHFDGKIDDVRVWSTIRTALQISNNRSLRLAGNESNLVAYWPFEDIVGGSFIFNLL